MIKRFLGLGWKSKIIFKRATAYISINKLVVEGCNLEKGGELYSYLAEDDKRRKIRMEYDAGLDNRLDQVESTNYNKNGEWRRKTDYGGNGEDDLIVISPGYKEYNQ